MKNIKDFYNDSAQKWDEEWDNNNMMLPYLKKFRTYFINKPRILDLGCNSGYESRRLAKLNAEVIGIDISEECIKIAKDKNDNILYYIGDMRDDLTYLGMFDGVIALASLIHINGQDIKVVFKRIAAILKTGGYFMITVKDGSGKDEKASLREFNKEIYNRDYYCYTKNELSTASKDNFLFVEELIMDDEEYWKTYIYKKIK